MILVLLPGFLGCFAFGVLLFGVFRYLDPTTGAFAFGLYTAIDFHKTPVGWRVVDIQLRRS